MYSGGGSVQVTNLQVVGNRLDAEGEAVDEAREALARQLAKKMSAARKGREPSAF